jgi:hypothetical protein
MAKTVLIVAALALLSACDSAPQPDPNAAEKAAMDTARQQELEVLRTRANALNDPEEILALLGSKGRFSSEFTIVTDRLSVVVKPMIQAAKTPAELRALRKYTLPGSSLVVDYMQRESELSRPQ